MNVIIYYIIGLFLVLVGAILCFSVIGAIIGIPMIIVGSIFLVLGKQQLRKDGAREIKTAIEEGIAKGAREAKRENVEDNNKATIEDEIVEGTYNAKDTIEKGIKKGLDKEMD